MLRAQHGPRKSQSGGGRATARRARPPTAGAALPLAPLAPSPHRAQVPRGRGQGDLEAGAHGGPGAGTGEPLLLRGAPPSRPPPPGRSRRACAPLRARAPRLLGPGAGKRRRGARPHSPSAPGAPAAPRARPSSSRSGSRRRGGRPAPRGPGPMPPPPPPPRLSRRARGSSRGPEAPR